MSGKRLALCGLALLLTGMVATASYAATPHPLSPDPRTCNVHVLAGVLTNPSLSFVLAVHNYAGTTEIFDITAFLAGGTTRGRTLQLPPDRFALLFPPDIPIVPGEVADIYVCWRFGTTAPIPPGSVLLIFFQGQLTAIPSVAFLIP
jgi:hypothetical protein